MWAGVVRPAAAPLARALTLATLRICRAPAPTGHHLLQRVCGAGQRELLRVRGDVALRGVGPGIAAHGHVGVGLVLVHAHVVDEELGRQGLAEAGVEPAFARVRLAVKL